MNKIVFFIIFILSSCSTNKKVNSLHGGGYEIIRYNKGQLTKIESYNKEGKIKFIREFNYVNKGILTLDTFRYQSSRRANFDTLLKHTSYYDNGKVSKLFYLLNDKKYSVCTEWYESGNKKSEGYYQYKYGDDTLTYKLKEQQEFYAVPDWYYKNKDGKWMYWYDNGNVKMMEFYNEGRPIHKWFYYKEDNTIDRVVFYCDSVQ